LSTKTNYYHQSSGSDNEELTISSSLKCIVPANSKGEIIVTAKRAKITVPFKYTERVTYSDGRIINIHKNGIYESVESYDTHVELRAEKIVEQTALVEDNSSIKKHMIQN